LTLARGCEQDRGLAPTNAKLLRIRPSRALTMAKGISALKVIVSNRACFECRVAGGRGHVEEACYDQAGQFQAGSTPTCPQDRQRYTEARAELEKGISSLFAGTRPFEHAALKNHLEARYGIHITSLAPIDDDPETRPRGSWPGHYPSTLLVKREDGPPWMARIFSSPAHQVSRREMRRSCGSLPRITFPPNRSRMTILCRCSTAAA
jgi:hypothetical protein